MNNMTIITMMTVMIMIVMMIIVFHQKILTRNVPHQMRDAWEEIISNEETHEHKVIYQPLNFKFRGHVDRVPGVWDPFSSVG